MLQHINEDLKAKYRCGQNKLYQGPFKQFRLLPRFSLSTNLSNECSVVLKNVKNLSNGSPNKFELD